MVKPTRIEKRYCKLRNAEVSVLVEGVTELGSSMVNWVDRTCLNKDNQCKGCGFIELGGKHPF